jgi:DNA-binding NtrC family response regulator
MSKVLIVEDDTIQREILKKTLGKKGFDVDDASSGEDAIDKVMSDSFDVVLLDIMLPKLNGLTVLTEVIKNKPKTKVIIITGFASIDNAVDAIKKGASDYISKPYSINDIVLSVRRAIEETRFDEGTHSEDLDITLSSLSNPIRRNIMHMLYENKKMHLMELTRDLEISDHTKVLFHIRMLKNAGLIEKDQGRSYCLTSSGTRTFSCLKIFTRHLSE